MFGLALTPGFLKVSDVEILTNQLGTTEKLNLNLGSSIHTTLAVIHPLLLQPPVPVFFSCPPLSEWAL